MQLARWRGSAKFTKTGRFERHFTGEAFYWSGDSFVVESLLRGKLRCKSCMQSNAKTTGCVNLMISALRRHLDNPTHHAAAARGKGKNLASPDMTLHGYQAFIEERTSSMKAMRVLTYIEGG